MKYLILLINIINNAFQVQKFTIEINFMNSLVLAILNILQKLNIINSFQLKSANCCIININYNKTLKKIVLISKLQRKYIYTKNDLIKLRSMDLYNDYIISCNTQYKSMNLLTIDDAIKFNKGGIILFKINR